MPHSTTAEPNRLAWVDLATPDAAGARDFYSQLFGWQVEVSPDPQYGGYGIARVGDADVAGIGPKQSADAPTAWGLYVGTTDVDALVEKVRAAGGDVIAPPFDVGDQGRMTVFADPTGAVLSAWQAQQPRRFLHGEPNALGWAELSARGLERALPFYESVFGWTRRTSPIGDGQEYTEFLADGESVAGAFEMDPQIPADVPSYWTVYFSVDDVDAAFRKALDLRATELVAPQDYPGGRFAILQDPQGATFAILRPSAPG